MISINCTAVKNEVADNRFERSELNWLIYNDPTAYAELILNGEPEKYLKAVTVYRPFESSALTMPRAIPYGNTLKLHK